MIQFTQLIKCDSQMSEEECIVFRQIDSVGHKTHVRKGIMKIVRGALVLMKEKKVVLMYSCLKREYY